MDNKFTALFIIFVGILLSGCNIKADARLGAGKAPTSTSPMVQRASATWTPTPEPIAGLQTPVPGRVPVIFATAPDGPTQVWFEVYTAAGEMIFQGGKMVNVLYLPGGDYYYAAMVPVPTQPLWCHSVEQYYGYSTDGKFKVEDQPLLIEVKLGSVVLPCTPTPSP